MRHVLNPLKRLCFCLLSVIFYPSGFYGSYDIREYGARFHQVQHVPDQLPRSGLTNVGGKTYNTMMITCAF